MSGAHVIDIDRLVDSVTREQNYGYIMGEGGEHEMSRTLIHKINIHIRNKYKNTYAPTMLTLGPYNHGIPGADSFRMIKYEFLNYILQLNKEKGLQDYLEAMSKLEKRVQGSYADEILMGRNEFFKMLLLDGCFILTVLCGREVLNAELQDSNEYNREIDVNEEIIRDEMQLGTNGCKMAHEYERQDVDPFDQFHFQNLWHDLLLLENQIPFFVISKIQETIVGGNNLTTSEFVENIIDLVEIALGCYPRAISKSNRPKEFHHLLHLCHMYFRPCSEEVESFTNQVKPTFIITSFNGGALLLASSRSVHFRVVYKQHKSVPGSGTGQQNTIKQGLVLRKEHIAQKIHIRSLTLCFAMAQSRSLA